jgi:hypothetical protein
MKSIKIGKSLLAFALLFGIHGLAMASGTDALTGVASTIKGLVEGNGLLIANLIGIFLAISTAVIFKDYKPLIIVFIIVVLANTLVGLVTSTFAATL